MMFARICLSWLFLAGVVLLPHGASAQASNGAGSHPNVVLIVMDACRADRLDATRNGHPVMPALTDWASRSVRFTNATSACTWTRPAMASILTSLYVEAHQVDFGDANLSAPIETMAAFFKSAGYDTVCIQTNGHLVRATGFGQGFDTFDDYTTTIPPAESITNSAIARVQGATAPFFLYVHYMDPHVPYWPPQTYRTLFGYPNPGLTQPEQAIVEDFGDPDGYMFDQVDYTLGIKPTRDFAELSATGKDAVRTLYDADCRYTDTEVARLIGAIGQQRPDTIFVVTADHGEHLFEHAHLGHGLTLYDPVFRVPLIVGGPGLTPATVSSNVTTVDILPTVAALAGLPARPAWQGRDLFAPRDPQGPVFAYTRGGRAPRLVDLETVGRGSMKLIHNIETGGMELYDVVQDPAELNNLATQYPAQVAGLQALLDAHREDNIRARVRTGIITPSPSGWIEEGMALTLTAPVGTSYQWKKDGADITGATTRTLTLNPVVPDDAGTYECRFDDGAKSLQYTLPYILNVLPPNSVPAATPLGSILLLTILAASPLLLRRRYLQP